MPAKRIQYGWSLRRGTEELNKAIDAANAAEVLSTNADTKATQALSNSVNTQEQLDTIVINGDSSVEAAQARVDATGTTTYTTLKERLDTEYQGITADLADILDLECDFARFGILPDTGIDYTTQIKDLISQYKRFVIKGGTYIISDELLFKHGQTIRTVGKVVLDGSDFVGTNGNNVLKVTNDGDNYTQLPNTTSDIVKGSVNLVFQSAHGLVKDDVICIYDNTPNSYSSARAEYKKGEFARVLSIISTTEVMLDSPIYDNYDPTTNVNVGLYKMNMGTFNVFGDLEVIQGKAGNFRAVYMERLKDCDFNNIKASALNGSVKGLEINQCFNVDVNGVFEQEKISGLGVDYGLAITNSQHIRSKLYATSSQHAVTTSGTNSVGAIVNRDINVNGVTKSNKSQYTFAIGLHGNTELFSFDGVAYGGIMCSGNNNKYKGTSYANSIGVCVVFSEVKGFNHDLSGLKCFSELDPTPRGIIDFGGFGVAETNNMLGGLLNMSNVSIDAPETTAGIVVRMRNTNVDSNSERFLDISGANIKTSLKSGNFAYRFLDSTALKNFKEVNAFGVNYNSSTRIILNTDNIIFEPVKGKIDKAVTTSVNQVLQTVTFNKPFPSGYIPQVYASLRKRVGNTSAVDIFNISSGDASNTNFVVRISTKDGSNFPVDETLTFDYVAQ